MALDTFFNDAATAFDSSLISGMNDVISSGLSAAHAQLTAALSLYVIGYGLLTTHQKVDSWEFGMAAVRAFVIATLLQSATYNTYVQQFFFTDLPNQVAAALHGPRISVSSAQQFDVLWSAALNATSKVLSAATGWTQILDRGVAWFLAILILIALLVSFIVWYMSRVFMALVICIGPFLLILFLFRSTRGFVEQWIGKLVGLSVLQIASSVLLRIVMVMVTARLHVMQDNLGSSVDDMIASLAGICGVFWMGALLMICLPGTIAIGSGVGAGAAMASGRLTGAARATTGLAMAPIRLALR
jgi:type IV secretion system protein VirB6